jgi:superfamily II DNA/RNA helicase
MALLIGGVSMGDQTAALEKGVDVLIATPGRLMDLFARGKILLTGCSLLVIDEADRMLDMGFIPDIEDICTKLPKQRQTLLFSATMPPPIKKLADKFLSNPKTIEVARPATANTNIKQWVVPVTASKKRDKLEQLLEMEDVKTAIIFSNRKTTVRELNKALQRSGFRSSEIHGDMEQSQRIAELDRFKAGDVNILVASDVAARGLDIKGVSHVFNYDAPWHPDDYVHRIGRTGRAGATGVAFTFATADDVENIENIEKLTGLKIERYEGVEMPEGAPAAKGRGRGRGAKPKAEAPAPRAPAEAREPRPAREPREERPAREARTPREERPAREGRAPRDERPAREARPPRDTRPPRDDRAPRRDPAPQDDGPDDGWNGPMPGFLSARLTD